MIVEVDGGYHSERGQQAEDQLRESALRRMGYHTMSFTNEEVLYDIDNVLQKIAKYFT